MIDNDVYIRYCQIRDTKGLKDSQVATMSGVTKSTFSDWKAGRYIPKQDKLTKIANALDVSVEFLVTGEQKESKYSEKNAHLVAQLRNDETLKAIIDCYNKLNQENKMEILKYAQYLCAKEDL